MVVRLSSRLTPVSLHVADLDALVLELIRTAVAVVGPFLCPVRVDLSHCVESC
jgi:hypothetical protein